MSMTDNPLDRVGTDIVPSDEMVIEGRVGNGSFQEMDAKFRQTLIEERQKFSHEIKKAKIEAYEEGMAYALRKSQKLTEGIMDVGLDILERKAKGDSLNKTELTALKLAQEAAKVTADRVVGKSTTHHESVQHTSIVQLIAGVNLDGE